MRFMIIMKANEETEAGVMPTEEELAAMGAYNERLGEAGILRAGEGLHPSSRGVRVAFAPNESPVVTDGPFAETKELIAGFWIFEVDSLNEALQWVEKCPVGDRPFEIEIRQVFSEDDFGEAFTPELRAAEEQLRKATTALSESEIRAFIEKLNEAWFDDDKAYVLSCVTDDVVWNMVGGTKAEGKQAFTEMLNSMPSMTTLDAKTDKILVDGNTASVMGTMRMRAEDGSESSFAFCDVYTLRGSLVCDLTVYVLSLDGAA